MISYKKTIKSEPVACFVEAGFVENHGLNEESFNASSSLSFSDTSCHNQPGSRKRPMSNAERQKRYREKHKNTEYYAQWRKWSAERAKTRRDNYKLYLDSLNEEEKLAVLEKNRSDNRVRMRRHRDAKKAKVVDDFTPSLEPMDNKEASCGHLNCQICPAYFAMRIQWEKHIAEERKLDRQTLNGHTEFGRHDCFKCGIVYRMANFLNGHLLVHTDDCEFHQCQHCLVAFMTHADLQTHLVARLKQGSCNTLWPDVF